MALIAGPDPVAYPALAAAPLHRYRPGGTDPEAIGQLRHLPGAAWPSSACTCGAPTMAGRRARSPSGPMWRRRSASMSAASASSTILLASAMAGVAAVSVGMLYGTASAFVGLLYGLKAFICMLVAGNRYFEGVMVVALAHRRHRGAGHRLSVLEPARRGGVLRADRRAATSGRTGCSAPTRPDGHADEPRELFRAGRRSSRC